MTPYKQAFVATLENGNVLLVVVAEFNSVDGRSMAKDAAANAEQCAVWDICAYPTTPELEVGTRRIFSA